VPFQTVMLTGTGFSPLESVQVYWDSLDSLPLTSTMATTTGGFVARLTVPQAVSGTHTLIAVGQSSGVTATATVRVAPLLLLSPSSGRASSVATAVGFGFGAAEPLKLCWDKPFTLLGSTTTDARGSFGAGTAIPATVPLSAAPGLHYVVAVGPANAVVGLGVFSVHS
jgi:hypothetical protein